jgi:putative acetyltransferase
MRIFQANIEKEIEQARELFQEYETGMGTTPCFQNFSQELAQLPGDYGPPAGRLLLVSEDDQLAGCIALRKLGPCACEMKRLFLRPSFRGSGLGRILVDAVIQEARNIGYTRLRLETLPGKMDRAIALYHSLGFTEIPPYNENPVEATTFMELNLESL